MVTELRELLHDTAAHAPRERADLGEVLRTGRRRVRRRRAGVVGGTAVAAAAVVAAGVLVLPGGPEARVDPAVAGVPRPDGPVLRLADARVAVEGEDYRVVTSYTNENLDRDNGQYLDGATDDGLVLFRDGPRNGQLWPELALLDPATGAEDWLPRLEGVGQDSLWPVELSEERLVLMRSVDYTEAGEELAAHVFDRATREWSEVRWPDLPRAEGGWAARQGPDGRIYVLAPATRGQPPEGGWPIGPGGEADDADAEGDTFALWSASLEDPTDVRDEQLRVGAVAFTATAMVWTDGSNGDPGQVHVRDLASGEERSFDPRTGEKCNLLGFGAVGERIVMSQYCGTYADGVRDDRVQVLSTDGDLVTTIQDSGVEGGLAGPDNSLLHVSAYTRDGGGHYVYDLEEDRFLRLSDDLSKWAFDSQAPDGQVFWHTPVNRRRGATQWLGELLD